MRRLQLLVPQLQVVAGAVAAESSELARCLGRAHTRRVGELDLDAQLFAAFGLASAAQDNLPIAPLTAAIDLDAPADDYLRCDPVHLHADPTRVFLFDQRFFELTDHEADALIERLNFEAPELRLCRGRHPGRWYARPRFALPARLPSPQRQCGRPLVLAAPIDAVTRRLHALYNRLQMALFEHPVNRAREARGELALNGVCLWGAPRQQRQPQSSNTIALGDDVVLAGLAQRCDIPWEPSCNYQDLAARGEFDAAIVVPLPTPGREVAPNRVAVGLETLALDWIAPAMSALRRGRLRLLEVHTKDTHYLLDRWRSWRWWRRPRAVGLLTEGLSMPRRA